MQILAISDVHGRFSQFNPASLPEADLCVVAGDMTNRGRRDPAEWRSFLFWWQELRRRYHVLWIPGNHDLHVQQGELSGHRCHCLWNKVIGRDGLSFYGVSMSPAYDMPELASQWANMTTRWEVEEAAYAMPKVDIVVSHCPPYGILDAAGLTKYADGTWEKRSIGSNALRNYIDREKPRLVICGHVHGCAGAVLYGQTAVVNVAETWALIEVSQNSRWERVGEVRFPDHVALLPDYPSTAQDVKTLKSFIGRGNRHQSKTVSDETVSQEDGHDEHLLHQWATDGGPAL